MKLNKVLCGGELGVLKQDSTRLSFQPAKAGGSSASAQ